MKLNKIMNEQTFLSLHVEKVEDNVELYRTVIKKNLHREDEGSDLGEYIKFITFMFKGKKYATFGDPGLADNHFLYLDYYNYHWYEIPYKKYPQRKV